MEELLCIGCGAPIQTEDKGKLGYTPQSALEKGLETGELYCQRCFRLRHYNEISDVQLPDDDSLRLLSCLFLLLETMFSWLGIKRTFCLSRSRIAR